MSKRDDRLLLQDMLGAIQRVLEYTDGFDFERFMSNERTKDAVVRNFEILGEASNRISATLKDQNSNVPWHKLRGYRNRLIHEYFGVDYELVWEIISDDLQSLLESLINLDSQYS